MPALWLALLGSEASAERPACRQALALGLDVSASVDKREYALQLNGLAVALGDGAVISALLAAPADPVQILVFEWSGLSDQRVLIDWTEIKSRSDIAVLQESLSQIQRRDAAPGTALGPAILFGLEQFERAGACRKRTLDISGDGRANSGVRPETLAKEAGVRKVTINALVIEGESLPASSKTPRDGETLVEYFVSNVIVGRDAFVETAADYDDYTRAMTRKLKREVQGPILSALDPALRIGPPAPR